MRLCLPAPTIVVGIGGCFIGDVILANPLKGGDAKPPVFQANA
jgi:hypothetical protein